jgi:outer membrane protein assembly factor BamD
MSPFRPVVALLAALILAGCSGTGLFSPWDGQQASLARGGNLAEASPDALYAAGIEAIRAENFTRAGELFDAIERDHPYSPWATNAKLLSAYSQYMRNRYPEAIGALDRFIQLHPAHRDIAYAYYLRALAFYEQINQPDRDQSNTVQAMTALQDVANRFPETPYARDARLKLDLARDHLAGREMVVGRFYQNRRLYTAAIGRFRRVVEQYQTTNHVPEALHRLTEIYLALGLTDEARRTASVLGHNYPGSEWYRDSYALLTGEGGQPPEQPGFFGRVVGSIGSIF